MLHDVITEFLNAYQAHPVAQIFGLFGLIITVGAFQLKTARQIVLVQSLGAFIWLIHFSILGAYAGAFLQALSIPRNIIYSFRGKKSWADSFMWPLLFSFFVLCVCSYSHFALGEGYACIAALGAEVFGAIAFFNKSAQKLRALSIVSSAFGLVYNFISGSIAGVIMETMRQISLYVALFRYRKPRGA